MKKPAWFTTIALLLCAADARAQTQGGQLDEVMATSDLARRIERLTLEPGHDLQGEGHWMSASAVQKGRIEAVLEGREGESFWYLDAFTTEYLPGVGPSARFLYGGVYGTLHALDGTEAAPILVQGEWARHGQGSPYGSLMALVFRPAPFPLDVEVLGTLTGGIQFFEDASGADGGTRVAIVGVQRLAGAGSSASAIAARPELAVGLARPQDAGSSAAGVRVLGTLDAAQRRATSGASSVPGGVTARPIQPGQSGQPGQPGGVAIQASALGSNAQGIAASAAESAPSVAGTGSHMDRYGTCGTVGVARIGQGPTSQALGGHQGVAAGGLGAMQVDGLVRLVWHVLD